MIIIYLIFIFEKLNRMHENCVYIYLQQFIKNQVF